MMKLRVAIVITSATVLLAACGSNYAGPPTATAECRDGTYSYSQHRQGTCSHHGGVSEWNPDMDVPANRSSE